MLFCRAVLATGPSNEEKAHMPVLKNSKSRVRQSRSKAATAMTLANPKLRARFEKRLRYWEKKVRPLKEAARASERLTEHDFAVRINARG